MDKRQRKKMMDLFTDAPAGSKKRGGRWNSHAMTRLPENHPVNLRRSARLARFVVVAKRNGIALPWWFCSDGAQDPMVQALLRADEGNDRADWVPVEMPPLGVKP